MVGETGFETKSEILSDIQYHKKNEDSCGQLHTHHEQQQLDTNFQAGKLADSTGQLTTHKEYQQSNQKAETEQKPKTTISANSSITTPALQLSIVMKNWSKLPATIREAIVILANSQEGQES